MTDVVTEETVTEDVLGPQDTEALDRLVAKAK
jgi:hypothetical protein